MIVHLGVVVIAVAFAASASNVRQQEFTLNPGDTATFAGHTLTFERMNTVVDENKTKTQALVLVDGSGPYAPGINTFPGGSNVIGTPSVRSTLAQRRGPQPARRARRRRPSPITIRVTIQPLIMWLWIGGGIMAVGTLLAAFPAAAAAASSRCRRRCPSAAAPIRRSATAPSDGRRLRRRRRSEPGTASPCMTDLIEPTGAPDVGGRRARRRRRPPARPRGPQRRPGRRRRADRAGRPAGHGQDRTTERQPEARILGQAVPVVQGATLDGGSYDIDDHLGNWVVVNFFASWCTPCRVEQPELVKFDQEHPKAGDVEIVSVVFQDKEADVKAFFDAVAAPAGRSSWATPARPP